MLTVGTLSFGGHLLLQNNLTAEHLISFILYQESLGECFSEIGEVYTGKQAHSLVLKHVGYFRRCFAKQFEKPSSLNYLYLD